MAGKLIEHIEKDDSLNKGRVKINEALGGFQTQIDSIVVDGDSSVEAAQARVNAEGRTYDTLKARLDDSDELMSDKADEKDINELERNKADRSDLDNKVGKDELEDLLPDAEFKGVLLALENNISTTSHEWKTVNWDKAEYNFTGFWNKDNPSRIVIPFGVKKVKLSAGSLWVSNSEGSRRIRMKKNDQYTSGLSYIGQRASGTSPVGGTSSVIEVREGDYITLEVYQSSEEDIDLRTDPYTYFSLEVVEYSKK